MNQYCRYCVHAFDYNGEETDFICEAKALCGNDGAGKFYPASKAKRINKCKHFLYNENDIFRTMPNGDFVQYKPRERQVKEKPAEQTKLF